MRLVIVNPCHPDDPHICGRRAARFAEALAGRGHQVVLFTPTVAADDAPPDAGWVKAGLEHLAASENGGTLVVACPPAPAPILSRLRNGRLPAPLRKLVIAWRYGLNGSVFPDWRAGAARFVPLIADAFRPDMAWGIFGNTEAWHLARMIGQFSGCHWAMDVKDPWEAFIPPFFRTNLAMRYANAATATALSEAHAAEARRYWPHLPFTVVRSGLPEAMLSPPPPRPAGRPFTVMLMGGLYEDAAIEGFLAGLRLWAGRLEDPTAVAFVYAGSDHARLAALLEKTPIPIETEILETIPLPDLFARMARAGINVAMRGAGVAFHHKVFELFAADRPILVTPFETEETTALAREVGADLSVCASPEAIAETLEAKRVAPDVTPVDRAALARYAWDAQAEILERALSGGFKT